MTRWRSAVIGALLALGALGSVSHAVQPDEVLSDAALESRARDLSAGLRCMVCQNQSIDDSDAPLARDLRLLVRERLVEGDSDGEVLDYLVSRYGEFVLLRPRLSWATAALWTLPGLILILGAGFVIVQVRRGRARPAAAPPLSAQEERDIARLLDQES